MPFQGTGDRLPLQFLKRDRIVPDRSLRDSHSITFKIRGLNPVLSRHQECPFHQILQLTNISRERQPAQEGHRLARELHSRQAICLGKTIGEMTNQQGNIIYPLTEGRQMNRDQIDPIEKILAECVFFYHLGQVTIRRAYHPDIHLPRPAVA